MRSRVFFADERLKSSYDELKGSREENERLHRWIERAISDIGEDAFCGIQIPKRLIPKVYVERFCIDNLWKYDLPQGWRLLYSVTKEEIFVVSIILEWMSHKEYERRFRY
jgi:Txe/YoeB family toxin of Txe-Axe toxin-antitoxin module